METVYLETTVVSYLVARPASDLIVAAHQQVSLDWWNSRRDQFNCVVSQVVLDEISVGDANEVEKRLDLVKPLQVLSTSTDAEFLTLAIMNAGVLPQKAIRDAAHIAVASVYGVEYLLTWNCKHLANAQISKRIQKVCEQHGYQMPLICTPEVLLEETDNA